MADGVTAPPHDGANAARRARPARTVADEAWRAVDDAALLVGMRAGDERAHVELYARHVPLLRNLARRLRPGDASVAEIADDVLSDMADRCRREETFAPASLPAYLAGAFVRRLADVERRAHRRRALEDRAAEDVAGSVERVLREVVSEFAVRACAGPGADHDDGRLAPALARLAGSLGDACSADERVLLRLLADGVTQPDIARELGLSYGAARTRIHRFRKRIWAWAAAYVAELPASDRAEVRRFLRRAGGTGGAASTGTPHPEPSRARRAASPPEITP